MKIKGDGKMFGDLKKTVINKLLAVVMMIAVILVMLPPVNLFAASDAVIDLGAENQVIRGFGGIFADSMAL